MNVQKPPRGIEWTRIALVDGTRTRGFTWNPVTGCLHACEWIMPDGTVVQCYAKTDAERPALRPYYPEGFEVVQFHPDRLDDPLRRKTPAGIFIGSMADLMGHWVADDQVRQVLDVCREASWHTFFVLTKNAPRLARWAFPPNVWVGASMPPDHMWEHALTRSQQEKMLHRTLQTLARVEASVRWLSFEPLSWDPSDIVRAYPGVLTWAVIGAASAGRTLYPPEAAVMRRLLDVLDAQGVPVFYKGNLRTLPVATAAWRENFPAVRAHRPELTHV